MYEIFKRDPLTTLGWYEISKSMQIQGGGSYAFFKVNIRPTLVQTLRFPAIVFFGGVGLLPVKGTDRMCSTD